MRTATLPLVGLVLATCAQAPQTIGAVSAPWPEADVLFRRDPSWRGGDAAYSVDLGAENGGAARTLWLFGDSFVAKPGSVGRRGCAMVRNSIAVQEGADPTTAAITFHWRGTHDAPASWFAEDGDVWHWPLAGLRIGEVVTVFCTRVRRSGANGPFGFQAIGWTALALRGVDGPVPQWRCEPRATFASPFPVVVGTAVVAHGAHVYAYALAEPGTHAVYALRWPAATFAAGDLLTPEWFDAGSWRAHATFTRAPTPVLTEGAPEFSVSRTPTGFAMVQSLGFGHTDLAVRTAPAPEGPWSEARVAFRPPESSLDGVFVYAGKAHPQLTGDEVRSDLVATYASNAWDFGRLIDDETLYFPRFVRLRR